MKVAFVFQYFPYQYEQFKVLADYLDADCYYRIHTDDQYTYYNSKIFSVSDGSAVHYKDFAKFEYDCLVYTGTWCKSLLKFSESCKFKDIVCMSHSLIGSLYDISIVTPATDRGVGFVPHAWTKFPSFDKRNDIMWNNGEKSQYVKTSSHPIAAQACLTAPRVRAQSGALGVILGHRSPFKHFSEIVDDLVKSENFTKVKVKLHPLTEDEVALKYFDKDYIEILPKSYDKYDWLDSCGYVIGGCSSLLVEEMIRAERFDTGQKFKQFPFQRRGIPLSIESHDTDKWSSCAKEFVDFARDPSDICREHKNVLEEVISGSVPYYVIGG